MTEIYLEDVPSKIVWALDSPSFHTGRLWAGGVRQVKLLKTRVGWKFEFGSQYEEDSDKKWTYSSKAEAEAARIELLKNMLQQIEQELKKSAS